VIWLGSRLLRTEPLSVTALHRPGGDIQYYELVAALARGNFGESNLWEAYGQGLHPFPLAGIAVHALCFSIAGAYGLILADALVAYAFFVVYGFLARILGASERVAATLAAFAASYLFVFLWPATDLLGFWRDLYWGDRFPRPYVTSIFVYLALSLMAILWTRPREARTSSFFMYTGVAASLLVQSDIYATFILGLACLPLAARLWHHRSAGWERRCALHGAAALGSFSLTVWPFVLQQSVATPELLERWGSYSLSRLHALSWITSVPLAGLSVLTVAAAFTWLLVRNSDNHVVASARANIGFWFVVVLAATVALPLFSGILGQGLYPYMFPDRIRRVAMDGALFLVGIVAIPFCWRRPFATRFLRVGSLHLDKLIFALAVLASILVRAKQNAERETHVRPSFYNFTSIGSYRQAFAGLARELEKPIYSNAAVLGTLDQAVHVFWQMFHRGYAFVPDAWISIAGNAELEYRFAAFARVLEATEEEFRQLVTNGGFQTIFVSVAKYATNREHTYAPLSEYSAAQRSRILNRNLFVGFQNEVPEAEVQRFERLYRSLPRRPPSERLDVIVLTNDALFAHLAPPLPAFRKTFENKIFRVYLRSSTSLPNKNKLNL